MKRFLLYLFLFSGITGFAQHQDTSAKTPGKRKLIPDASTVKKLEKIKDSAAMILPVTDKQQVREDMSRNIDNILQLQQEQKAKQKRAAMIRIAIGLALLALLIIGLRRRRR